MGKQGAKTKFKTLDLGGGAATEPEESGGEPLPPAPPASTGGSWAKAAAPVPAPPAKSAAPPAAPKAAPASAEMEDAAMNAKALELKGKDEAAQREAVAAITKQLFAATASEEIIAQARELAAVATAVGVSRVLRSFGVLELIANGVAAGKQRSEAAFVVVEALCMRDTAAVRLAEPHLAPLTVEILLAAEDRAANVRAAAEKAVRALCADALSVHAVPQMLTMIFKAIENPSWRVKESALKALAMLALRAPRQIGASLPVIVPHVSECLWDTKPQVQKAASIAITDACAAIANPDIAPAVPKLIAALAKPAETIRALDEMLQTTFVATVDAATLAIAVPALARGLRDRKEPEPRRKAATIIKNMCRVVADSRDVAPFVPKLLPELERLAGGTLSVMLESGELIDEVTGW